MSAASSTSPARRALGAVGAAFVAVVSGAGACPTGPQSFCEAEAEATCSFLFNCCEDKERVQLFGSLEAYVDNEGECKERRRRSCKLTGSAHEESIGLGRLKWNGDKASACIDAQVAARDACDASLGVVAECGEVLTGLVKDGDACALSEECGEGGSCDVSFDDPDIDKERGAVLGKCNGPVGDGEDCRDTPCARGLICDVDAQGNGTCKPLPEAGDDCIDFSCAAGSFCDIDGICAELKDDGADCDPFSGGLECRSRVCTDGACGSGVCNGK